MDYHELDQFQKELASLETFFTELAVREDEVTMFGIREATQWKSFEAIKVALIEFEIRVLGFLGFVRSVDKKIYDNAQELIQQAKLIESIANIQVIFRIAAEQKPLSKIRTLVGKFVYSFPAFANIFPKQQRLFSEEAVSIQRILVALGRLKNLVKMANETYIRRWSHDSDIFKPSNLDEEIILQHIETAITEIERDSVLPNEEKKQLIEYLNKAKSELSEDRPSWNKIIGALVIVATIIGGIAMVPQAYENIDAAIKYILGTSVRWHIPKSIPLLEPESRSQQKKKQNDALPIHLA